MLRAVVALLLLANLGFLAWTQGLLAPLLQPPRHGQHEPERLAAQIHPQAVVVLPPKAASAALVAARAQAAICVEAGPLADADLAAVEAELAAAQWPEGSWSRQAAALPPLWLVYGGRWPDAAARRAREAELLRLGLSVELLTAPPDLAPGLVLSRHASRAEAEAALAKLNEGATAVRGTRVVQLPPPAALTLLRLPRADADVQARLAALPAAQRAGGFRPCAAEPARP